MLALINFSLKNGILFLVFFFFLYFVKDGGALNALLLENLNKKLDQNYAYVLFTFQFFVFNLHTQI